MVKTNESEMIQSPSTSRFEPVDSKQVGKEFVLTYYRVLNEGPEYLFRMYNNESTFVHGGIEKPGHEDPICKGQKAIKDKIASLNFQNCNVKVLQVDSQQSLEESVVVQVIGEMLDGDGQVRRFMQSFMLIRSGPLSFCIRNAIFRYQDEYHQEESEESEVVTEVPHSDVSEEVVDTSAPAETPAEQPEAGLAVVDCAEPSEPESLPMKEQAAEPIATKEDEAEEQVAEVEKKMQENKPTEPAKSPAEPAKSPAEPAKPPPAEPAKPSTEPAEPAEPPAEPAKPPAEPAKPPAEPAKPPAEPAKPPAEPAKQPAEPAKQPAEPAEPAKPQTVPAKENNEMQERPKTFSWAAMVSKSSPSGVSSHESAPPVATAVAGVMRRPVEKAEAKLLKSDHKPATAAASAGHEKQAERPKRTQMERENHVTRDRSNSLRGENHTGENGYGGRRSFNAGPKYPDEHQLFVGNVPLYMTERELITFFESFGNVIDLRINTTSGGGRVPNFGFVVFDCAETPLKILRQRPVYYNDELRLNVEEKKTRPNVGRYGSGPRTNGSRGGPRNGDGRRPYSGERYNGGKEYYRGGGSAPPRR